MKKLAVVLALGLLMAGSAKATILEDFEGIAAGTQITLGSATNTLNWGFAGGEMADAYVVEEAGNQFGRLFITSSTGATPGFSAGLIQKSEFTPLMDLTGDAISFRIRTDFEAAVASIVAVQITADTNEDPGVFRTFRTPDASLKALPALADGWQMYRFNINSLVSEAVWASPDLTQVSKVEILFLQNAVEGYDIPAGAHQIDIDVLGVPEPSAMLLFGFAGVIGYIKKRFNRN